MKRLSLLTLLVATLALPTATHAQAAWQAGHLSAPSSAQATSIASAYLDARTPGTRVLVDRASRKSGSLLRFEEQLDGIPIIGGESFVRLDLQGQVRYAQMGRPSLDGFATQPALLAQAALQKAAHWGAAANADLRLIIYAPPAGEPRLAYEITNKSSPLLGKQWQFIIDAHTGERLHAADLVQFAQTPAWAYERNPVATPTLNQVQINVEDGFQSHDAMFVQNCHGSSTNCFQDNLDDGNKDLLGIQPEADAATFDVFPALQAQYHLDRVISRVQALPWFNAMTPLNVFVNTWLPAGCGDGSDQPYNNAYHNEGTLVFGQGTATDFAIDGDVVYHEFGHALIDQQSAMRYQGFEDEMGGNSMPRALHEGFADLVTLMMTQDRRLGSYAAQNFGLDEIRDLNTTLHCPEDMYGESHADSQIFTGAMFSFRETLEGSEQVQFDELVLSTIPTLGPFSTFETASNVILAELAIDMPYKVDSAREIFGERGLLSCDRNVTSNGIPKLYVNAFGVSTKQFHITVAAKSPEIDLRIASFSPAADCNSQAISGLELEIEKLGDDPEIIIMPITVDPATGSARLAQTLDLLPGDYALRLRNNSEQALFLSDIALDTGSEDACERCDGFGEPLGPAEEGGCATAPGSTAPWWPLLLAFIALGRRRQD